MRRIVALAVVAAVVAGCSAFGGENAKDKIGYIVFDSYTQDASFGFTLDGIYVDQDGMVWRYHSDEPWFPEELRLGMVSESDLLKKTEGAKRVGSVSPLVLAEMIELIEPASKAEVVREMQSFERSGSVDVAYLYDRGKKRYSQVVLKGTGTWSARNTSVEARQLLARLEEVKRVVGFQP
jgi:hypothetical protein